MALLSDFVNQSVSHLATIRPSKELYKMEGFFYRQKDVAGDLLTKEKKGLFLGQVIFWGEKAGRGYIMQITSVVLISKLQTQWFTFCKIYLLVRERERSTHWLPPIHALSGG